MWTSSKFPWRHWIRIFFKWLLWCWLFKIEHWYLVRSWCTFCCWVSLLLHVKVPQYQARLIIHVNIERVAINPSSRLADTCLFHCFQDGVSLSNHRCCIDRRSARPFILYCNGKVEHELDKLMLHDCCLTISSWIHLPRWRMPLWWQPRPLWSHVCILR